MKLITFVVFAIIFSFNLHASDLNDGIAIGAGFSSTNDDIKLKRNYAYTKMDIKAKIERAKYDGSIKVIDGCGGAGNMTIVDPSMNTTFINNSNNSGAVTSCEKK
ncbi:MAG: hypothetical protein QM479_00005 [Pseudomonadota bacterium]